MHGSPTETAVTDAPALRADPVLLASHLLCILAVPKETRPAKREEEIAPAGNKWMTIVDLLRRHLRQYLIGHGPFFLICLHAAAKSVVFWRHCGGESNLHSSEMKSEAGEPERRAD